MEAVGFAKPAKTRAATAASALFDTAYGASEARGGWVRGSITSAYLRFRCPFLGEVCMRKLHVFYVRVYVLMLESA